jgi:ATP-dependent protease HslVU (ClpYQ) peptidase subunit
MDSIKSDGTLAGDAKIRSDLFKLVENLRIELQEKDDELQVKDQELQKKDEELAKETQEKQVSLLLQVCT